MMNSRGSWFRIRRLKTQQALKSFLVRYTFTWPHAHPILEKPFLNFRGSGNHDAHEFMLNIFDFLHHLLNRAGSCLRKELRADILADVTSTN